MRLHPGRKKSIVPGNEPVTKWYSVSTFKERQKMKFKKSAAAIAAMAAIATMGIGSLAHAATYSEACPEAEVCSLNVREALKAGAENTVNVTMAEGVSIEMSLYNITAETSETEFGTEKIEKITAHTKVADLGKASSGAFTFTLDEKVPGGSNYIIAPSDWDGSLETTFPVTTMSNLPQLIYVKSNTATSKGFTQGSDFYTFLTEAVLKASDVSPDSTSGANFFAWPYEGAVAGSKYTVQIEKDGKWVDIAIVDKENAPDNGVTKDGGNGQVMFEIPDGTAPGTYTIRLVNKDKGTEVMTGKVSIQGADGKVPETPAKPGDGDASGDKGDKSKDGDAADDKGDKSKDGDDKGGDAKVGNDKAGLPSSGV